MEGIKLLFVAFLLKMGLMTPAQAATNCAVPPTCAQLGYVLNADDCKGYYMMRCPFALTDDNQVYCHHALKRELVTGKILYGDGTVSKDLISGKTPIGVVFDETNRLAIALTYVKEDGSAGDEKMNWFNARSYDIPTLENCDMETSGHEGYDVNAIISCTPDGRANTDKILACGDGCGGTPAATACNLYEPSGCTKDFCKKGKWFLPSMRDLHNAGTMAGVVRDTLEFLKDFGADNNVFNSLWSSNEATQYNAWRAKVTASSDYSTSSKEASFIPNRGNVRPVVKY